MPTLQIEHEVPSYEGWKKAFDSDPIDRKGSGVKHYRIYKLLNESKTIVVVELDFDDMEQLRAALQALQNLWSKVQGTVMIGPKTRVIEMVESKEL